MGITPKQQEYLMNATRRYGIKVGAVASGKTWIDLAYVIPKRIIKSRNEGLITLIGNTRTNVEMNILAPMREIWGDRLVGGIRQNDNTVELFGKRCYVVGADKASQVKRIQGTTIEYCYGDEVATWSEGVFDMLKSRLRTEHSAFDGTCNPEGPGHWFKRFIDSDADIYLQEYTIDDNPYLPETFVENIKKEYAGTVNYDRLILGKWVTAEGAIYRQIADRPEDYIIHLTPAALSDAEFFTIGIDFGGTKSLTTFVATALHRGLGRLTVVRDHHIEGGKGDIDADRVSIEFISFVQQLQARHGRIPIRAVFADSEAQYLINSLRRACRAAGLNIQIGDSAKRPIRERITATNTLLNTGRLHISDECNLLLGGLKNAVWDSRKADCRLDNGTSDVDILDAFEYSWERFIPRLAPNIKTVSDNANAQRFMAL